ncbi:MAG TPA: NAD-dependent epimerase/dehydratase family protein [Candidatus Thermoplasmatota archaeon]|nr:NAD-dependent epimerase/dehydratase family protein [Candidatus Thermoplasmatota archaeon]
MAKTLVLGGTGFIGGAVVAAAAARGPVRGLTRGRRAVPPVDGVEWLPGDLGDPASLEAAFAGVDTVLHAAGHYPRLGIHKSEALARGIAETRNVIAAARAARVKKLVYVSSLSTLGPPRAGRDEADEGDRYVPGAVDNAYFAVKYAMETELLAARDVPVVAVVPTFVFGPGDVKPTSGRLVLAVARHHLPAYVEGHVNVVDVRDVAEGVLAAAAKGRAGERYILGNENVVLSEWLALVAERAGAPEPSIALPYEVARAMAVASESATDATRKLSKTLPPGPWQAFIRNPVQVSLEAVDLFHHATWVSTEKAAKELGWAPKIGKARSIDDTLADFKARGLW